jgi:hypothetical protein
MKRLVQFGPTRAVLFALADRGILRRRVEHGVKRALVESRAVDSTVTRLPSPPAGRSDDADSRQVV